MAKILVVEDDPVYRKLLEAALTDWNHQCLILSDGEAATALMTEDFTYRIILLDWMLPGVSGIELCRTIRLTQYAEPPYVIILTGNDAKEDVVKGLKAGADDYITKPFHREELKARLSVGVRILNLQNNLASRVKELELALGQVNELQGLIPICAYCKKIREDGNYWRGLEAYVSARSAAKFSHGVCPDCKEKVMQEFKDKVKPKSA